MISGAESSAESRWKNRNKWIYQNKKCGEQRCQRKTIDIRHTGNFAAASETELPALYLEYEEDSRAGVQNLIQKYQKQEEALKKSASARNR